MRKPLCGGGELRVATGQQYSNLNQPTQLEPLKFAVSKYGYYTT